MLGLRVFLAACVVVGIFTLTWLVLSWEGARKEQIERIQGTADIIADGANKHFDLVLGDMSRFAADIDRNQAIHSPGIARLMLRQFLTDNHDAIAISLQDMSGHVVAMLGNPRLVQEALAQPGDSINHLFEYGRPLTCDNYHYCLPFRFYWRNEETNTHFSLVVLFPIQTISQSWKHMSEERGVHIGLLRQDGVPLSWVDKGKEQMVWSGEQMLSESTLTHFDRGELQWPDGVTRYTAVTSLHKYRIASIIGVDSSAIIHAWWQSVRLPVYLISGMTAAALAIYFILSRRFSRRMEKIGKRLQIVGDVDMPSSGVFEIDHLVGELMQSRAELQRVAENREKLLLSAANAGTYSVDLSTGLVLSASSAFLSMLGYAGRADAVVDRPWGNLFLQPPVQGQHSAPEQRVVILRHADGHPRWIALAEYDTAENDQVTRHGMAIDVTEREQLLQTVHNQSERLRALWQLATDRDLAENERIELMLRLGQTSLRCDAAMIVEVTGEGAFIRFALDGRSLAVPGAKLTLASEMLENWLNSNNQAFALPDCSLDALGLNLPSADSIQAYDVIGAPIRVGGGNYGVLLFWCYQSPDHTPGAQEESDLAYVALLASWFGFVKLEQHQRSVLETQALTDGLTGLPNRRAAELRFASELSNIRRAHDIFAVAVCDLDRFKLINDHYGHPVGDEVLKQVAVVMQSALREGDWLARWGGEEFIVYLRDSDAVAATQAMERLRLAVKTTPINTPEGELDVTTSIGIGVFRGADDTLGRVLSEADGCLYEAKRGGRDSVVVHESETRKSMLWHAGMLKRALQDFNINPAFQVIVDLKTRQVVADEALARLKLPSGQILAASEFVEAAEAVHLIHSVDETIIQQAMMRCKARIGGGTMSQNLAHFVNVSPQFLQRPELVANLLRDAQLFCANCDLDNASPKPLVFEITERQLVDDFDRLKQQLQPLIDFGFRFALDDFGSGYSSFLYLAQLPVAFLKIEGWMIQNMWDNPRIAAMLESIVLFAKHQGITTIAEFIEDERTAERLQEMGVDWGQGYYFGRPELE